MSIDPSSLIYDRTKDDVLNETDKGFYRYTDLNRIEGFMEQLSAEFQLRINTKTDWARGDYVYVSDLVRIQNNLASLKRVIRGYNDTPLLPETLSFLTYEQANNIEKILFDIDSLVTLWSDSFRESGTFYAGEE